MPDEVVAGWHVGHTETVLAHFLRTRPRLRHRRSPEFTVYDGGVHLLDGNPKDKAIHRSRLRGTTWTSEGACPDLEAAASRPASRMPMGAHLSTK
ncbi:hypothetical protein ACFV7Q_37600 [Streptomyces sp. NPDC059851]|uniref:hypothetical protein n=1 Tax=Streptomyces sp. NPDC059851 TaxID=3346971 RepID=UPI003663FC5C